jgi:cytochrome c oxidase accessory protein FixG
LFDKDTMQIAYDYKRGEPRGKLSKQVDAAITGDCIDCHKCVQVCPTGIDIRDGVQMECVGCTACVDACDEVMFKINKPLGLIRYASENEIATGNKFRFNGRMKAYSVLLIILLIVTTVLVFTRKSIDTHITRVRGQLYQEVGKDTLGNLFNAIVLNKTNKAFNVTMKLENIPGEVTLVSNKDAAMKPEAVNEVTFFIRVNKQYIHKRSTDIKVGIYKDGQKIQTVKTVFLGPFL